MPPRPSGPGEVNEVCVVIKDSYYAVSPGGRPGDCRSSFGDARGQLEPEVDDGPFRLSDRLGRLRDRQSSGILLTPSLVVAGPVYTSDVFAIPSVKKQDAGAGNHGRQPLAAGAKVQLVNEIVPSHPRLPLCRARQLETMAPRPRRSSPRSRSRSRRGRRRSSSSPSPGQIPSSGGPTIRRSTRRDQGPPGRQGRRRPPDALRLSPMGVGQPAVHAQRPAVESPRRHGCRG